MVQIQRGIRQWVPGRIVREKGPVIYLVEVGERIRFCHLDHLRATGVKFGVEQQVDMDNGEHVDIPIETTNEVPQLEQPVIPENFKSERVTEEPAVVTPIAPTTPVVVSGNPLSDLLKKCDATGLKERTDNYK